MTRTRDSRWIWWLGPPVVVAGLAAAWSLSPGRVSGRADGAPKRDAETASTPRESKPLPLLEEAQREHLRKVEHQGNVLSKNGFKAVADALARADAESLKAILAEDFEGAEPKRPGEVAIENDVLQVVRLRDSGEAPATLDRAGFVAHLLEFRQPFASTPKVKLSLMGLGPVNRDDWDGPWQGTCLLRIWGESAPDQPAEVALQLRYRIAKPDEDSLAKPGWLRSCAIIQSQMARASRPLFREVADE